MKKAKLLWVDLEMTGLEPDKDKILEVAAIATDMQLNEIATYEAVVKVDDKLIKSRMVGDFWEKNSKTRDALIGQNATGKPVKEVERELLDFIGKNFGKTIYLAGNSIHQDRKFIEREMPELDKKLHGLGEFTIQKEKDRELYLKNGRTFLVLHRNTMEVRCDQKLSDLLKGKYESVMESRYFGRGGIEIVLAGQLSEAELADLVRLSYNITA